MNQNRAAIRYAKATLDFALEKKAADAVEKDMREIAATISGSEELQNLLESPIIKSEVKRTVCWKSLKIPAKLPKAFFKL